MDKLTQPEKAQLFQQLREGFYPERVEALVVLQAERGINEHEIAHVHSKTVEEVKEIVTNYETKRQ